MEKERKGRFQSAYEGFIWFPSVCLDIEAILSLHCSKCIHYQRNHNLHSNFQFHSQSDDSLWLSQTLKKNTPQTFFQEMKNKVWPALL